MQQNERKLELVIAECPKCGGILELNDTAESAFCRNCGAQYLVENVTKKKRNGNFEMILSFFDRQQTLIRQEKAEKRKKKEEEEREQKEEQRRMRENLEKNWWKYLLAFLGVIVFCLIMSLFE